MKKYLFLLLCSSHASAVYVNHQGLGDVLIIPYYTVNNNLHTLVTVTNTSRNSKAIKINIREGLNGYAVLSYNVYLGGFAGSDTWSFVLAPDISTFAGFVGQESASLISNDNSCAPFLNKTRQELSPDELVDGPQDLSRAREGFIEIIEMGELQGDFDGFLYQVSGDIGVPDNCDAFETAWQTGGLWHAASGGDANQDVTSGSGGLMAEADIISVAEGINYSIPVVALDDFFAADTIAHVSPTDSNLTLDAAKPVSRIMTREKTYELTFESGIDAVSAVLMADELVGTYALDTAVDGKTETVFTQPTRRFYIDTESLSGQPPYAASLGGRLCSTDDYGGIFIFHTVVDRESLGVFGGVPFPPQPDEYLCGSVFVQTMVLPDSDQTQPEITESDNFAILTPPMDFQVTENGFVQTQFRLTRPLTGINLNSSQTVQLRGVPVIGITLQQYTNAAAAEGVLARYGGSHQLRSKIRLVED